MTIIRIQTSAILLLLFVTACAKSNTRLASENDGGEESIHDGSARVDDVPSLGDDRPAATVQEEDSGLDNSRITGLTDAGVVDNYPNGNPPEPPIEENPEDRQVRLDLISEYCSLLEKFPCLESYYSDYAFDSMEQRVRYCEQELELNHYEFVSETSGVLCESEWIAVLECAIEYDYSCPCTEGECFLAHSDLVSPDFPYPCREDERAINDCKVSIYDNQVHFYDFRSERLHCTGYQNPTDELPCRAYCRNDGDLFYEYWCEGPWEGPYECHCTVNSNPLGDMYESFQTENTPEELIPDCESAVKIMADGRCHDITDCCITWLDDEGTEDCGCTADVTQSTTGATTCEELAAALDGEVVDLCP